VKYYDSYCPHYGIDRVFCEKCRSDDWKAGAAKRWDKAERDGSRAAMVAVPTGGLTVMIFLGADVASGWFAVAIVVAFVVSGLVAWACSEEKKRIGRELVEQELN
jgi:prolipoprotein diacylglyceryltransferase